jgi:CheY-like chemotaxis protein
MPRLLVVEDDPDAQFLVSHVLEFIELEIDVAGNAEDGGNFIFNSGNIYDAVVLDLALPGKDGWELLAEILGNPDTKHIPCIAVTAFHTSKLREEALARGFYAYFSKPIDALTFARKVEAIVQSSKAR